jgi:hypothetical protein
MDKSELAEKLEVDSTRGVQHNFLGEYYGFSEREKFLASPSQRTRNLPTG